MGCVLISFDTLSKELILTEKQKELRQNKIKENKKLKLLDDLTRIVDSGMDSSPSMASNDTEFPKEFFEMNFDINLNKRENSSQNIIIDEIHESIYREAVQLEFSVLPFDRPKAEDKSFNELESYRFKELTQAMRSFDVQTPQRIESVETFNEAAQIIGVKSDHEIRNVVKMCKQLNAFRSINERDQLILLKYASIEILSLRVINHFDFQTFEWTVVMVSHELAV